MNNIYEPVSLSHSLDLGQLISKDRKNKSKWTWRHLTNIKNHHLGIQKSLLCHRVCVNKCSERTTLKYVKELRKEEEKNNEIMHARILAFHYRCQQLADSSGKKIKHHQIEDPATHQLKDWKKNLNHIIYYFSLFCSNSQVWQKEWKKWIISISVWTPIWDKLIWIPRRLLFVLVFPIGWVIGFKQILFRNRYVRRVRTFWRCKFKTRLRWSYRARGVIKAVPSGARVAELVPMV